MAEEVTLTTLPLGGLFLDARLQLREPNPRVVTQYAEYFSTLPAVTVYHIMPDNLYVLIDGYHRYAAAQQIGLDAIPAVVYENKTYQECLWDGAVCNAAHGVPLDGAAKLKAAQNRLIACPERANRWIADDLNVSQDYVERARVDLENAGEIAALEMLVRRDGLSIPRTYASRDDEVRQLLAEGISDREISRRLRVGARVVARVREELATAAQSSDDSAAPMETAVYVHDAKPPFDRIEQLAPAEEITPEDNEPEPSRLERRLAELHTAPAYDESLLMGRLRQGDCLDLLAADRNQYDLICTDPPYGVKESAEWDITDVAKFTTFTHAWLQRALSRLSPSGRIYIFWTGKHWALLCNIIDKINADMGLELVPGIHLIWVHNDTNRLFYDDKDVKPNYDPILQWRGPDAENLRYTDPWLANDRRGATWSAMRDFNRVHEAEKPIAIVRDLIRMTTYPNDLVLDPFMGSGTTAVACEQLGRRWVGYEQDPATVLLAQQRIMLERGQQA